MRSGLCSCRIRVHNTNEGDRNKAGKKKEDLEK